LGVGRWALGVDPVDSLSADPRSLRQTLGRFVTGVTVIALESQGEVRAMTANSFTSLSLDPPLVLFCLGKETKAGHHIRSVSGFSVSILGHDQRELSSYFAGSWKSDEPPAFTFTEWEGGPRLDGCIAALGCRIHAIHEGGDHWIVVGHVVATYRADDGGPPLVFFSGKYASLGDIT
jgi:flavin reductase (DIM6/NTAB) family NADH-FMN oxidoreductase RutF